jgi:hypothetical protein
MPQQAERGQMSSPKILTIDIETAPLSVYAWGLWEQNVGVNQIKSEWRILSVAWKWLHEKKPFFVRAMVKDEKVDDAWVLAVIWGLLDKADIVVAQNGQDFDIKKINARLVAEGYPPYSPIRVIDTKLVAKRHFGFTSNRLEWMGVNVGGSAKEEHRKFPGFELWKQCLADNLAAWKEMAKYNVQDVLATEKLYLRLRPWIAGHPNVGTYVAADSHVCPKCGGRHLVRRGVATTNTAVYLRYRCSDCGGWSRGRSTILTPRVSRSLLGN